MHLSICLHWTFSHHFKCWNITIRKLFFDSREEICVHLRCSVHSWVFRVFHISWRMIAWLTEEQISIVPQPLEHVHSQLFEFFIWQVHEEPVGEDNIIAKMDATCMATLKSCKKKLNHESDLHYNMKLRSLYHLPRGMSNFADENIQ